MQPCSVWKMFHSVVMGTSLLSAPMISVSLVAQEAATETPTTAEEAALLKALGGDPGQDLLDEAMDAKVVAETSVELTKVIELAEKAIQEGLTDENSEFANTLLASSLLERAKLQIQEMLQSRMAERQAARLQQSVLKDLERAVSLDKKLSEGHVLIAKLVARNDPDRALAAMTAAVESLDDDPLKRSEAYFLRSALKDDPDEKLADLNRATTDNPENREAWQMKILILGSLDRIEEAYDAALGFLETDKANVDAIGAAAAALVELDRVSDALKLLGEKIESNPKLIKLREIRSRLYLAEQRWEEAIADATAMIEVNPETLEGHITRANAYIAKAESVSSNEDALELSLALRDIQRALDLKPNLAEAIRLRAVVAAQQKRYDEAIQDLTLIARSNPQEPLWLYQLAALYQLDERPSMAVKICEQLIRIDPSNWRPYRTRGDALLSMGQQSEAIEDYEKAISLVGKDAFERSGLLNNLSWILSTSPEEELRNGTRALELAKEACELTDYEQAHILSTLAAAYAELGNFEEAVKWSEKAVEAGRKEKTNQLEQLEEELEVFRQGKPWREKQETIENKQPIVNVEEAIEA